MRVHRLSLSVLGALLLPVGLAAPATAGGDKAPAVEPSRWFNATTPVSWDRLKGRVILVEKWATW